MRVPVLLDRADDPTQSVVARPFHHPDAERVGCVGREHSAERPSGDRDDADHHCEDDDPRATAEAVAPLASEPRAAPGFFVADIRFRRILGRIPIFRSRLQAGSSRSRCDAYDATRRRDRGKKLALQSNLDEVLDECLREMQHAGVRLHHSLHTSGCALTCPEEDLPHVAARVECARVRQTR